MSQSDVAGTSKPKTPTDELKLNVPQLNNLPNLKDLFSKRSSIKGRITKYKNFLNKILQSELTDLDLIMLRDRFEKFQALYSSFDGLQSQIEVLNPDNLIAEIDIREDIENDFSILLAQTKIFLEKNKSQRDAFQSIHSDFNDSQCGRSCHSHNSPSFKLPILKIENFDGSYFKWVEFRDTFTSLIHSNPQIKPIHKFHYLNSYLEGEASRVICNLEVSTDNYREAWRLLCERYNNEKQLIKNHLNSLSNIQQVNRDSAKGLRFIIDHVSKNLRALNTLGEPTESWDTLIIHLVSAKLDNNSGFKWEEFKNNLASKPTLSDFFDFLRNRADILESVQHNRADRPCTHQSNQQTNTFKNHEKAHVKSFQISAAPGSYTPVCALCNGSHRLYDCATFLAKPIEDRISEVVRMGLCLNCLRKGHVSNQCKLGPCSICKRRHNSLVHRGSKVSQAANTLIVPAPSASPPSVSADGMDTNIVSTMSVSTSASVLLSTALVDIKIPSTNEFITIRALLDSGSQSSLITKNLKQKLQLNSQPTRIEIVGVGNMPVSNSIERCIVQMKSKHGQFKTDLSCIVLPKITGNLPNKSIDVSTINLPPNIKLADPTFNQSAPVDMLIGADSFWHLIEAEQIYLGPNQPILRKTKLGWLLAGPLFTPESSSINFINCNHLAIGDVCSDESYISNETLNKNLAKFWECEQLPEPAHPHSEIDILAEEHFVKHTYRDDKGRFNVRLPLQSEPDCLGDSFRLAKRQFLALEKRFDKNPELKELYCQFIQEYSDLEHLTESNTLIPDQCYFIPHHAVLKPTSESTKLRVVFNGSAKTTSGYSINDLQMTGPHIQDLLFNILLRFRQYTWVLSGDVEKMYRMVSVQEQDRNLQMILWRNSASDPLKSYKLNTVTYGLSSSSFLSTRCLHQLGEECPDPKIKEIIQKDFLVDDLLTGSDRQDDLKHIKHKVEKALSAGCFKLRKYRSNLPSILNDSQNAQGDLTISSSSHMLGVGWNPSADFINYPDHYSSENKNPTKRSILSDSCKFFDPLGLLSLLTITPKILIQRLWIEQLDWDEPVPQEISQAWTNFIKSMKHVNSLQIPRHALCKSPLNIVLHCFCDASKHAYATCIYLRSVNEQGEVTVRLLCAKARVGSVKPTTIPRLELCACVLGARLAAAVCRTLRCVIARKIFWTDSSIALAWLGTRYDKLKTFVANRVGTILELTNGSDWRHVPSALNPADLASRGADASQILNLDIWWNGPNFLQKPETSWPNSSKINFDSEKLPEVKVNTTSINENNKQTLIDFERYSKMSHLQRSFAYVVRFINNCRNRNNKIIGVLQPEELTLSFKTLIRLSQEETFTKELGILRGNKSLNSKNSLISLNPFLDETNALRVGGRLNYSCYPFEKRHPLLLHARHRLTKLLFQQEHLRLLHAGPQLLLSSIRESVWPIAGRDLARTTARQCVVCRRISGRTVTPLMGALPTQRVNPDFPFLSTGIDMGGPFFITDRKGRGCKITKCYLCVFICYRYKCLHLEAVSELSKDAFIQALRRFISRRGKPTEILCDNGRNFVAAFKEIGDFLRSSSNDIINFSTGEGIKFIFSPAYAPHFGGYFEAAIKSAKFHLKRILGNSHLTFEELATLFSQIEAILNSRPLCPLSSSPNDFQPLTPGHFLIGRSLTSLPSPSLESAKLSGLNRFQRLEQLRQHFWKRWQLEYVTELQQRHKWRTPDKQLQVGELVLLKEENAPPMQWKLGRITVLFPGKDGINRVAEVKTTTGTYRRGVQYLCPLLDDQQDVSLESETSKAPEDVPAHP